MVRSAILIRIWLLVLTGLLPASQSGLAGEPIWLDVDTNAAILRVMQGNQEKARFENISIGRFGTTRAKSRGDKRTPLGRFRVTGIHPSSHFHLFIGLDYPSLDDAYRAFRQGRADQSVWQRIRAANESGKPAPQNTPLGGNIGIHGLGRGDPQIHERLNWTNGCIALTNGQIDRLRRWVRIGTEVDIH